MAAQAAPSEALRIVYGVAMLGLAWLLAQEAARHRGPTREGADDAPGEAHQVDPAPGATRAAAEERTIVTADGTTYRYRAHGLGLQRVLSGSGAFVAGLISTGVGEATLPALVRRSRFPVPVAAATSTVIVAATVVGAARTHLVQLAAEGGLAAIPWNLLLWAVPGAVLGAFVGTRLQGRVNETASRWFFSGLFAAIGVAFLLAFTIFAGRFS